MLRLLCGDPSKSKIGSQCDLTFPPRSTDLVGRAGRLSPVRAAQTDLLALLGRPTPSRGALSRAEFMMALECWKGHLMSMWHTNIVIAFCLFSPYVIRISFQIKNHLRDRSGMGAIHSLIVIHQKILWCLSSVMYMLFWPHISVFQMCNWQAPSPFLFFFFMSCQVVCVVSFMKIRAEVQKGKLHKLSLESSVKIQGQPAICPG